MGKGAHASDRTTRDRDWSQAEGCPQDRSEAEWRKARAEGIAQTPTLTMSTTNKTKVIEGWVRPSENGPGYELGNGAGWCEFNECGQPNHGDLPATLVIGEKAWPESKVKEMLRDVLEQAQTLPVQDGTHIIHSSVVHVDDLTSVLARHDITL